MHRCAGQCAEGERDACGCHVRACPSHARHVRLREVGQYGARRYPARSAAVPFCGDHTYNGTQSNTPRTTTRSWVCTPAPRERSYMPAPHTLPADATHQLLLNGESALLGQRCDGLERLVQPLVQLVLGHGLQAVGPVAHQVGAAQHHQAAHAHGAVLLHLGAGAERVVGGRNRVCWE